MARLELAWHQAYHAEDCVPVDTSKLINIPAEKLARSTIVLHPSVRLLESAYPVLQIWESNQTDNEVAHEINLDSGGEALCVYRPYFQVQHRLLNKGEFIFLSAINDGLTLEQSIQKAIDSDPELVAEQCLAQCLTDGLFKTFYGI